MTSAGLCLDREHGNPCNGPVFPAVGGVNPALTIETIAMQTAARTGTLAKRGEL